MISTVIGDSEEHKHNTIVRGNNILGGGHGVLITTMVLFPH